MLTPEQRLKGIERMCGFLGNGSQQTLTISQDDATNEWCVSINNKLISYGRSFSNTIDIAIQNEDALKEDYLI